MICADIIVDSLHGVSFPFYELADNMSIPEKFSEGKPQKRLSFPFLYDKLMVDSSQGCTEDGNVPVKLAFDGAPGKFETITEDML